MKQSETGRSREPVTPTEAHSHDLSLHKTHSTAPSFQNSSKECHQLWAKCVTPAPVGTLPVQIRTRAFTEWWASHCLALETLACTLAFSGMLPTLARRFSSSDHLEEPPAEASLS